MNPLPILITLLVTAISLFIISKLPIGVEIDSIGKTVIAAVVFGILNALLGPILHFIGAPLEFLTLGLFALIINAFIFGLSAWLVSGFRLKWGIWSALLGSFALSIINSVIHNLLPITTVG